MRTLNIFFIKIGNMDISYTLKTVLERLADTNGIVALDEPTLHKNNSEDFEDLLDAIGELSKKARGLSQVITSSVKLTKNHMLYIKIQSGKVIGFAKVQRHKKLFKPDGLGGMQEIKITAIVDFFIHPNYEGQGHGKQLFEHVIKSEYFPNNNIGFYKITNTMIKFLNRVYKSK